MKIFESDGGLIVRLVRGEEIHGALTALASERNIRGAVVSGIGAVHKAELGFFNWDKRQYDRRPEPGNTELLSLNGNLCLLDGKPFLHAHVVLMRSDFSLVGGHLFRAEVAVTGEFAVRQTDLDLTRVMDEEIRLALLEQGGN